jgi:hypothetical protein
MKRLMMVLVAAAAVACMAGLATAGDYHVGRLLVCSDCHIAHGSQSHGYFSDDTLASKPTEAYPTLLRGETATNACLTCHDGKGSQGIADVLGDATGQTGIPNGRSAGALNVPNGGAHGYTNDALYSQGNGHTLWSTATPPGYNGTGAAPVGAEGLECTNCHGAHGNKYFRNLQGKTATSTQTFIPDAFKGKEVTYAIGLSSVTASSTSNPWVVEKSAHNYDNDNVQYLEPDATQSMYGSWCGSCHGEFHGSTSAANIEENGEIIRHPTAGVDGGVAAQWAVADPLHRLKVMDNSMQWAATAQNTTMTPSCFTCHKSHGNQNKFGLVFVIPKGQAANDNPAAAQVSATDPRLNPLTRTASMTEQGDGGQYRDMCKNCHGMGTFPAGNPTNLQ